jgi:hypothetical protein
MKFMVALATLAACGDNLHPQEMPDAAPPDAFAEATHAAPPQVVKGAGNVLAAPTVVPIFFANDPAQPTIEQYLGQVASSPYWTATTSEYGIGTITVAPSVVSQDTPPTTDTDLETWLTTNYPTPDPSTIYTVFLPGGVTLTQGGSARSCIAFGGYHSETSAGLVYALIPRCLPQAGSTAGQLDNTTGATSHELIEAASDPHPFTAAGYERLDTDYYVMNRTPGGELGDMCEYVETAFQPLLGSFVVQRTWSNASAAAGHDPCVPALDTPYVGAAPDMPEMIMLTTRSGTITTPGVTVNNGTSQTIDIDLFSDSPTSDDFEVEALDAATINGTSASLAFIWNKTTGHNGDKLRLMITRTKPGTSRGSELMLATKQNGKIVSIWWGLVAGQ